MALALAGVLAACGSSGPPIGRLAPDELYERGMREYEEENWLRAIQAFERLTTQYPTHPQYEEARFYLADSYYGNEEYITAAEEFVRFATDFGNSSLADDARFRTCEAYDELSPEVQLDQKYTRAALEHCGALVEYYPSSEYAAPAREIVDRMRNKLARKVFIAGEFYYGRQAYDSAIVYFEEVVAQHEGTEVVPRALLRLVQIYEELGYEEDAEETRSRLLSQYPDSPQAEQARNLSVANGS